MPKFRVKLRIKEIKHQYLINSMGHSYSTIYTLMLIGVEFAISPQISYFSSHEGDHIGTVPRKYVDDVVCFMRRRFNIEPNTLEVYKHHGMNYGSRPRTYGHGKISLPDNWQDICTYYWKKPFIINN